jgi:ParB family chromosome partitioning protein
MRGLDAGSEKAKPEFSDPLMRRLTAHRTKALQVLVADNAQVALAVLAHTMVQQVIEDRSIYRHQGSADVTVRSCDARLTSDADDMEASPAWVKLRETVEAWGDRLPGDSDRLLPWLIRQPQETLVEVLALCTALTLDAGVGRGLGNSDVIAEAVGLDMADWWAPTAGAFLAHVPKAKLAEAVKEAVSEDEAAKLGKLKKGDAVAKAEALLAGTRWLPTPLRSSKAV